ncbi:unnamed protein product [Rotaria socialis]|uniref:G-protein coupled receptors family 1 profile domain-containing protein n=1 Tax=Rotaria socialis TaxID=392032 RepID=A0A818A5F2_9BILA|nr:unnamed protein product [Rotaria socialis]CAF3403339.1 unnamed protein product [Rotaria socialis]CAF4482584.1 unnamed protein product [Rotaria socialis]CAF4598271.1 unnamed protein product [Rotaria socialis]
MTWLEQLKFWVLLTLTIPSTICSILIFIYFYQQQRKISIYHHLTLLLTIGSFLQLTINFPFIMAYYHRGTVIRASSSFCLWWNWWEYSINGLLLFVMAWGSIERHILVFNRAALATRRNKLLFHILPMVVVCFYPGIFYFAVMILNTCTNQWNYDAVFCQIPCYLTAQQALATYDFIGNVVFPVSAIAIANGSLIFRIVWQKRHHQIVWRRQYKLTRQLVLIAVVYMAFWFPLTINGLITTFAPTSVLTSIQVNYFFFLLFMIPDLLPFTLLACLSNFTTTIFKKQPRSIVPMH